MPVDDIIRALRTKEMPRRDELEIAAAVHETWKVAARDRALHARIGTSRVAVAFYIIRDALRRDVILALMRLWDKDRRAVDMKSIANSLCDTRVVNALAADCESHWDIRHHGPLEEMSEEGRAALQNHESAFAREQSTTLRARVVEVIDIVASYCTGGSHCSTFAKLEELFGIEPCLRSSQRHVSNFGAAESVCDSVRTPQALWTTFTLLTSVQTELPQKLSERESREKPRQPGAPGGIWELSRAQSTLGTPGPRQIWENAALNIDYECRSVGFRAPQSI